MKKYTKSKNTASGPLDKKFLGKGATGPNTTKSSLGSVKGQDHMSQKKIMQYKNYTRAK